MQTFTHLFSLLRGRPEGAAERADKEDAKGEMIEKLARAIVSRRLEAPAVLLLELNRPLGFLLSQGAFLARPFVSFFLPPREVEAAAQVLDDPVAFDRLIARIDELKSEETS